MKKENQGSWTAKWGNKSSNKKMEKVTAVAAAGYDKVKEAAAIGAVKAKAAAVVSAAKVKTGTSTGFKWIKDKWSSAK
ncbi:unnamed protein product [Withania somnifera]